MAGRATFAIPTAFSSVTGLGAPVAFFGPSRRARVIPLVCAAVCAFGAALVLVYGLAASATAWSRFGVAAAQSMGSTPALVFGLLLVGAVLFLIYALLSWSKAVGLYEGGIAMRGLGRPRSWLWSDATAFYAAITRETGLFARMRHKYTLEHLSGERASFDDRIENVAGLGETLGEKMVELHYAEAAARFNAGEPANFGELSLDQRGIQLKDWAVPWADVAQVTLRRGYLEVHGRGGAHRSLRVAHIPNLQVLLGLLENVTELKIEE
jgi:hypothetical protein